MTLRKIDYASNDKGTCKFEFVSCLFYMNIPVILKPLQMFYFNMLMVSYRIPRRGGEIAET